MYGMGVGELAADGCIIDSTLFVVVKYFATMEMYFCHSVVSILIL